MVVKITKRQMQSWRNMESEHTKSKAGQERIVRQHVEKYGQRYYPELKKLEARLKK